MEDLYTVNGAEFRLFPDALGSSYRMSHHSLAEAIGVRSSQVARELDRIGRDTEQAFIFEGLLKTEERRHATGKPRIHRWLNRTQALHLLGVWGRFQAEILAVDDLFGLAQNHRTRQEGAFLAQKSVTALNKASRAADERAASASAQVVELEARLELQNRHLVRHQEFTKAAEATEKGLRQELSATRVEMREACRARDSHWSRLMTACEGIKVLESRLHQEKEKIKSLEADIGSLESENDALALQVEALIKEVERLKTPREVTLSVPPSGKYARPGWFSYRVAGKDQQYAGRRGAHGLGLLADLGVCDRNGAPSEAGRRYCKPDAGFYKWDMALVELMETEGGEG